LGRFFEVLERFAVVPEIVVADADLPGEVRAPVGLSLQTQRLPVVAAGAGVVLLVEQLLGEGVQERDLLIPG